MKNIISIVVSVVIAVVLVSTIVIPTVENGHVSTDTQITLQNTGTPLIQGDVSSEYDVKWDSNLPAVIKVNGDVTTVYFNKIYESATVSPSSKEVTVDLTYGELPTPTCDGYTFDGWFTSTEYTTEVTETTIVVGTEDKILYAKWVANEYTVTFDADGGTVSPATKTVTFGQEYGELPTPTYTGHIFGGWFDSDSNPITSDVVVRTAENHTLTAVWTLENYLISFTVNDNTMGTVNPTEIYADYGDSFTVSGNTVVFGETTVTASALGSNVFDSWNYSSGTVTGAMTFVATFNNPPVTLYFTTDGTTGATVSTASYSDVPRGTEYVVADNTVTVTGFGTVTASLVNGYYFTGWSVQQGIGTVSAETTFEAQYELIQIKQVARSGGSNSFIVTMNGELYGAGYYENDNHTSYTRVLPNETINKVIVCDENTSGIFNVWAITEDGKAFGWGNNNYGQQSTGDSSVVSSFTDRTPSGETIVDGYVSSYGTNLLTEDGKIYCAGYFTDGAIKTFTDCTPSGERVTYVESHSRYSNSISNSVVILTLSGKVYFAGSNNPYTYGNGTNVASRTFIDTTPQNETVVQVSCTGVSSFIVTQSGKVYSTGLNTYGQLGTNDTTTVQSWTDTTPQNETVVKVIANGGNLQNGSDSTEYAVTWIITQSGKVYGCGAGVRYAQGSGNGNNILSFTDRTPSGETIADVKASIFTTWLITSDNDVYACGYNQYGIFGTGNTSRIDSFTKLLTNVKDLSIGLGNASAYYINTGNELFVTGANFSGVLGIGNTTNITTWTQTGPAGSIKITPVQSPLSLPLNPIQLSPLQPFTPILTPLSVTPSDVTTVNDWMLGGEQWMIVTVSLTDGDGIALYYAGLTEPLVFDSSTTFDFDNGTCTFSHNGTGYTFNYTSIYYQGSGNYVLLDEQAYVKVTGTDKSTKLSYYETGDSGAMVDTDGSVTVLADGSVVEWSNPTLQGENSQYDGVFILTSTQINADGDTVDDLAVIVPKSVTVTVPTEDAPINMIMDVIPVLMIVATLVFVLSAIFITRR